MIKKFYIILILCACNTVIAFACLGAYQFKTFPVGIADNETITVDFQIWRADDVANGEEWDLMKTKWYLRAYISTYKTTQKEKQQLIKAIPFDSVVVKPDYLEKLEEIYDAAFAKIQMEFSSIELFTPKYISFCDFQKKCKLIEMDADSVKYKNKTYRLNISHIFEYFGLGRLEDEESDEFPGLFYISSYRIYETKTTKLIIFHLATGDLVEARRYNDENIPPAKEHKPDFKFKNIKKSVYEEPLLHHGFGFDAFIIE